MLSKSLEQAINTQINKELFSEYIYFSMAAYLASIGLEGMENFFIVQAQEEHFHAMKMYHFINERGGRVKLEQIDKPQFDFESPIEIFEIALNHEKFISKSIGELMDLAIKENDHATKSFLNWYVDEQVEEEDSMDTILNKLNLINGQGQGLLSLDKELGARTFIPEEE
ncbi:MAG: ferritin [Deltaproteobacteria bacterium]|jgi:ferritin|nr:ferritin [Deltaproteobacteria bacterium]